MSNRQLNAIGLEISQADQLISSLNDLLSNYQVFYQNTRGFHWNIKGDKFFELHVKFEELYNDLQLKIDEIAERILTLGGKPEHTFSRYTTLSEIRAMENVSDGMAAVDSILASFQTVIIKQRTILDISDEAGDEGTNALMSDYISQQEKMVWMYHSYSMKPK